MTPSLVWLVVFLVVDWKALVAASTKRRHHSKPNIVLIITDDQDIELGSMDYMPNVRRHIQHEGAYFPHAYVTTPMCCPSRSSTLTGIYVHNHNVYTNNRNCSSLEWRRTFEPRTFANSLHAAGYQTGYFGKYLNEYNGKHVPVGWKEWLGLVRNSKYYNYTVSVNGNRVKHGDDYHRDYFPDLITNQSLSFLRRSKQFYANKPVLLVMSYPGPHGPEESAPQYQHLFLNETNYRTPSWNYAPNNDKQWILRHTGKMKDIHIRFTEMLNAKRLQTLQSVDAAVDQLIAELKRLGELENTFIFYTSDHGYHLGQFGLVKGKAMPYEFDIRVPFYVRGPKISRGIQVPELIANIDIAPTLLEIGQVPADVSMDGKSILPLLMQKMGRRVTTWRDSLLIEKGRLVSQQPTAGHKKQNHLTKAGVGFVWSPSSPTAAAAATSCAAGKFPSPCRPGQQFECIATSLTATPSESGDGGRDVWPSSVAGSLSSGVGFINATSATWRLARCGRRGRRGGANENANGIGENSFAGKLRRRGRGGHQGQHNRCRCASNGHHRGYARSQTDSLGRTEELSHSDRSGRHPVPQDDPVSIDAVRDKRNSDASSSNSSDNDSIALPVLSAQASGHKLRSRSVKSVSFSPRNSSRQRLIQVNEALDKNVDRKRQNGNVVDVRDSSTVKSNYVHGSTRLGHSGKQERVRRTNFSPHVAVRELVNCMNFARNKTVICLGTLGAFTDRRSWQETKKQVDGLIRRSRHKLSQLRELQSTLRQHRPFVPGMGSRSGLGLGSLGVDEDRERLANSMDSRAPSNDKSQSFYLPGELSVGTRDKYKIEDRRIFESNYGGEDSVDDDNGDDDDDDDNASLIGGTARNRFWDDSCPCRDRRRQRRLRKKERFARTACADEDLDGMNCFAHDNNHWKTPPLWNNGPFCFCQNANNNTFWCVRTVNLTHNFLYCEFVTGFAAYFDLRSDPYQLRNVIGTLGRRQLEKMKTTLNRLRRCRGARECTVRYRPPKPPSSSASTSSYDKSSLSGGAEPAARLGHPHLDSHNRDQSHVLASAKRDLDNSAVRENLLRRNINSFSAERADSELSL